MAMLATSAMLGFSSVHAHAPEHAGFMQIQSNAEVKFQKVVVLNQASEHLQQIVHEYLGKELPLNILDILTEIKLLIKTLRNDIATSHPSTNTSLYALAETFQNCLDLEYGVWPVMKNINEPFNAEWQTVTSLEAAHQLCRVKEVGQEYKSDAVGPSGACHTFVQAVPTAPSLGFNSLNTFWGSGFDPAIFAQQAQACQDAFSRYKSQVPKCTEAQKQFESASCKFHQKFTHADNACFGVNRCRAVDGAALERACDDALAAAAGWNSAELSLNNMECLILHLNSSNFSAVQQGSCDVPTSGTSKWNIICPTVAESSVEEERCAKLEDHRKEGADSLIPTDDMWVQSKYAGKSWFRQATNDIVDGSAIKSVVMDCDVPVALRHCRSEKHCNGHGTTVDKNSEDGCDCACDDGWLGRDCSQTTTTTTTTTIPSDVTFETLGILDMANGSSSLRCPRDGPEACSSRCIKDKNACMAGQEEGTVVFWMKMTGDTQNGNGDIPFWMGGSWGEYKGWGPFYRRSGEYSGDGILRVNNLGGQGRWSCQNAPWCKFNKWMHVAYVYQHTATGFRLKYFEDGKLKLDSDASRNQIDCTGECPFVLGAGQNGLRWNGQLKDFRILKGKPLSIDEVAEYMNM